MNQNFEKRKKVIYDFICDDMYVPMKIKEIAIVLQIPKEQRSELKKCWTHWRKKERSMCPKKENIRRERPGA